MKVIINLIWLLAILVIFSHVGIATTVYGNVYDLSLNKVSGARLEVNTTPNQYFISKDGSYSFDVPNGFYTIKAELRKNGVASSENKNITINREGSYVIDLILFPSFEEEDEISQELEITIPETDEKSFMTLFVIIFVLILGIIVLIIFKGKKSEEKTDTGKDDDMKKDYYDKDLDDIIDIIRKEGGRTTQKNIRKEIPLSEAKISLMVAELEHKGIIEKIKKGRGNIIILKQK